MQNLEQIRAASALRVAAKTTKADVNKLPAMVLANGLLAAAAFAKEANEKGAAKREKMKAVMDGVSQHLAGLKIISSGNDAESLIENLSREGSATLQRATDESLAFIGYVKRFAIKDKE